MSQAGYGKTFPKYTNALISNVSAGSSGDNTLVAGVSSQTIRVIKIALNVAAGSSVLAKIYDGASASGTLKGTFNLGGIVLDLEDNPIILTSGNSLVLNLGGSVTVSGSVFYVQD